MPSRRQIEEQVAVLRERHDGAAFADAVRAFSRELDEDEQETLREVLMERAEEQGAFDRGRALQQESRGWFRRQLDRLDPARARR